MTAPCPTCGEVDGVVKVIYFGVPMLWCDRDNRLFGFWSFVATWFPAVSEDEDGQPAWKLFVYEGSYPVALWYWLTGWGVDRRRSEGGDR